MVQKDLLSLSKRDVNIYNIRFNGSDKKPVTNWTLSSMVMKGLSPPSERK